jgi:hypothetical protein
VQQLWQCKQHGKHQHDIAKIASATITNNDAAATKQVYLQDNNKLRRGILNQLISYAINNSSATSSVGMPTVPFLSTGQQSDKICCLLKGATEAASKISKLVTKVRGPTRDIHITLGIAKSSLVISTAKCTKAGNRTIFTGNQVNIYDQHNTVITILQSAIRHGWHGPNGLYKIPLVPVVHNNLSRQPHLSFSFFFCRFNLFDKNWHLLANDTICLFFYTR